MIRLFNRFELKYIISASLRDTLLPVIQASMDPDPQGDNGIYDITSLYYDSRNYQFFRSKVDGIKYRRKVRMRTYGDLTSSLDRLVMVEIKQRINRTTQKRRLALPLNQAFQLCAGTTEIPFELDIGEPRDLKVAQEVIYLARSLRLSPACVVGYRRQAFVGSMYEPGLRITFDCGLWCATPENGLSPPECRHCFLSQPWVVMEVKANNAVPLWVSRMLARHRCTLTRYSKYCSGLTQLQRDGALRIGDERTAEWMS